MNGRISAKSMRQMFRPCDPVFIRDVCHAACCRSTTDPSGIAVTVTGEAEADRVEQLGGTVDRVTLRIVPIRRRCPFQSPVGLCAVHTAGQPFGCIASPFTLTTRGTLIVRNRYRSLKCYRADGAEFAYQAHRRALVAILGTHEADRVTRHLDHGGDDTDVWVPDDVAAWLLDKGARSKAGAA